MEFKETLEFKVKVKVTSDKKLTKKEEVAIFHDVNDMVQCARLGCEPEWIIEGVTRIPKTT